MPHWVSGSGAILLWLAAAGAGRVVLIEDWTSDAVGRRGIPSGWTGESLGRRADYDVPLLVVSILAGIGIGTVWTNTDALISSLARQGRLGATMGVAGSFKEFGDMAGPLLIGVLAQAFGLTTAFVTCGVLGLSCLAVTPRGALSGGGVPIGRGNPEND